MEGSIAAFTSLCAAMVKGGKVAICALVARRREEPQLVALVPEVAGGAGENARVELGSRVAFSRGFRCMHAVAVPWSDWRRRVAQTALPRPVASKEQVDCAREIAERIYLDGKNGKFKSPYYRNPALDKYGAALQHEVALSKGDVDRGLEWREKGTLPVYDEIQAAIGEKIARMSILVGGEDAGLQGAKKKVPAAGSKRKAAAAGGSGGAVKKEKKSRPAAAAIDWLAEYRAGTVGKRTVAQLKAFLTRKGAQITGRVRKPELVANAETILERMSLHGTDSGGGDAAMGGMQQEDI